MSLAYLMNSYPMTSTTFIRREIHAHEAAGVRVERFAVRPWEGELVDARDQAEAEITRYLLAGNALGLVVALLRELITNPAGLARALKAWRQLMKAARGGIGGFVRHAAYLMQAAQFRQLAAKAGVSHVHAHFGTNATAVALLSERMGGPAYSFTVHGPDELSDHPFMSYPLKIEHAKFVAAISHYCRSRLLGFTDMAFADKIKIIHCGIDRSEFTPSAIPDNKRFLSVGRLCTQKAQMLFPAAIAQVKKKHPDVQLVLIGDGDIRPALEADIARLKLEDNITLMGWCDGDAVIDQLHACRAFLLPSFAEGLPVVLMEAYGVGRPAISSYIAGIPELVTPESGWLVPASDVIAMADAMIAALDADTDTLKAKADAGAATVAAHHDIHKEAKALREAAAL